MKSKIEKRWSGYGGLNAKHTYPIKPANCWQMPDILVADVEVRVGDEVSINGSRRAGDLAGQITWRDNKARLDGSSIVRSGYGTPDLQDRFHNDQGLFNLVRDTLSVTDETESPRALNRWYRRLRDETYELGILSLGHAYHNSKVIGSMSPKPRIELTQGLFYT
jgi:hypothetical protein